jgi:hypothetical protein
MMPVGPNLSPGRIRVGHNGLNQRERVIWEFGPWSQVELESACEAMMRLCFHLIRSDGCLSRGGGC